MDGFGMVNWWKGEGETADDGFGWLDPKEQAALLPARETTKPVIVAQAPMVDDTQETHYTEHDEGYDADDLVATEGNDDD